MAAQVFTLLGVMVGAFTSYLTSAFNERTRSRREQNQRWAEKRLDTYTEFIASIKEFTTLTRALAATAGLVDRTPPIDRDEGLELLRRAELARGRAMERCPYWLMRRLFARQGP
ncbi:hypothetical protein [Actinomadura terrae]|uniref:hypothetical protein n=1 Tax=Actinomadura terrae TaxID=604353 RepID=UPI001FA7C5AE|nr:hypothetical protein [Actinomadura terrae]